MHLDQPYNPGFFLNNNLQDTNNVYPLPEPAWNIAAAGGPHLDYTNPANAKKIYDYLNKAGGSVASFATNPLWKVDSGPFKLKSFSPTQQLVHAGAEPELRRHAEADGQSRCRCRPTPASPRS